MSYAKVSLELLYHFNCYRCQKWWSIGDFVPIAEQTVYCPHCSTPNLIPEAVQLGNNNQVSSEAIHKLSGGTDE